MAVSALQQNFGLPDLVNLAIQPQPSLIDPSNAMSGVQTMGNPLVDQRFSVSGGFLSRSCQPAKLGGLGQLETRPAADGNCTVDRISRTERQDALWQDYFAHPSDWWDNRQEKRSPRHPDFRHKLSNEILFLDNLYKPSWVDSQLAICDAQFSVESRNSGSAWIANWRDQPVFRRMNVYAGNPEVEAWRKQCEEGELTEAVDALDLLVQRGSHIENSLVYRVLKRCVAQKDLLLGRRVHAITVRGGYESDTFLANHIIRMYASRGRLDEAMQVFTKVPAPDTYMWASIISAYAEHGQPIQAINLYRQMQQSTLKPNSYVFVAALKACANSTDLATGKQVHDDYLASDAEQDDVFVGSCLVDMYAKCGSLQDARKVFDCLPTKNVVTCTAMMGGYAQHGLGQEALAIYASMQKENVIPADAVTFVCLLQACSGLRDLQHGKQLHAQVQERGLEADVVVGNCLVDMYAKCGSLEDARRVFDRLPARDTVTWNAMIAGYVQHGVGLEALTLYESMQEGNSTAPDHVTFVSLLKACASVTAVHEGECLHAQIRERGLETDVAIGSGLVDMYSKCGSLKDARQVFDTMPRKSVVTWNAMIAGYAQHGLGQEALTLYESMRQEEETAANHVTFVCLLKACTTIGALHHGRLVHAEVEKKGLDADISVGNCLVEMYASCGSMEDARDVFDRLPTKDVITWTSLMKGYAEHDMVQEALDMYSSMQQESMTRANSVTFVCLLQACASSGALQQGKRFHAQLQERDLETDLVVANCLVHMYAKCGCLEEAQSVFQKLPTKDVVTWTALLNGYAEHGDGRMAVQCFEEMQLQGVPPNDATFACLLVACSHEGLVDEGQRYFKLMVEGHGMTPSVKHYSCMVDLLGRSGRLDEAENVLRTMPYRNDMVGWTSLLTACKSHGDLERGRRCFDRLIALKPENAAPYILLASMYASAGRWKDVDETESLRRACGAWKKPAKACIEVKDKVLSFTVGEERSDVSSKLRSMTTRMKNEGHVPQTELVLKAISKMDKEDALCGHAEKLALAYGLLNTPDGTPLLVTKNLRMCNDCHSSTKVMSRVEKRQIVVRDAHRVHRFQDGSCSCRDRK